MPNTSRHILRVGQAGGILTHTLLSVSENKMSAGVLLCMAGPAARRASGGPIPYQGPGFHDQDMQWSKEGPLVLPCLCLFAGFLLFMAGPAAGCAGGGALPGLPRLPAHPFRQGRVWRSSEQQGDTAGA